MRILNVIATVDPAGGGPIEWVRVLGLAAGRLGHVCEVLSMDEDGDVHAAAFPLPVHTVGSQWRGFRSPRLVSWLRAQASSYDCVIVHGLWRFPSFGTWLALHGGTTPYFVYPHGMLDPWFKRHYPLKHLLKSLYWPLTDYRVLRDARLVIMTCEEERLQARQSFGLYRAKEVVATLGVEPPTGEASAQRGAFLAQHPELAGTRNLLFLGRLHVKKGCGLLLRAFAGVFGAGDPFRLVMAGPGDPAYVGQLQALAAELGLGDRVVWTGMLAGDAKWGAFHAAEAFVLPSHQENFGIAVVEALACGVPVLLSDKVNIYREIVGDGAGFSAPDDQAGAEALLRLWAGLDPGSRGECSRRAGDCFARRFQCDSAVAGLMDIVARSL